MPFRRTCRALPNGSPGLSGSKGSVQKRNQMTGSFFRFPERILRFLPIGNKKTGQMQDLLRRHISYRTAHSSYAFLSLFRLPRILHRMMRPNNSPFFSRSRFSAHILPEFFPSAAGYEKYCHRPRISSIVFHTFLHSFPCFCSVPPPFPFFFLYTP